MELNEPERKRLKRDTVFWFLYEWGNRKGDRGDGWEEQENEGEREMEVMCNLRKIKSG